MKINPRPQLKNPINPEAPLYYIEQTDTTMNDAATLARQGCPHGTVIQAGVQSGGRGRFKNRTWDSAAEKNLLFTMILRKENLRVPLQTVPLICGLSTALGITAHTGLRAEVKWPNDVLVSGKKVCGILCEFKEGAVLAGIGVNVNQSEFSSGFSWPPISIIQLLNREISLEPLLLAILDQFHLFLNPVSGESPDWLRGINKVLFNRDREMVFTEGDPQSGKRITGIVEGVGSNGELCLRQHCGGVYRLISGEAQLSTQNSR